MKKSIFPTVIILFVFLVPFRLATMSPDVTGIASMISFILVIAGIVLFLLLTIKKDSHTSTH